MPPRKYTKRVVKGEGLLTDALSSIKKFVKSNKLVSKGLRHVAPLTGAFAAPVSVGADWVESKGWGMKKAPRKRMPRGSGLKKLDRGLLV